MDYIKYGGFTVPMPKLNKKETRGGSRQNAGAKPKYGEPTTTIAFRVPISEAELIKRLVKTLLNKWAADYRNNTKTL